MTGELRHNRWLTSRELLVHELHMQVEHLLLGFTLQQLQLLPTTHHVTQIPHLRNEGKGNIRHCPAPFVKPPPRKETLI